MFRMETGNKGAKIDEEVYFDCNMINSNNIRINEISKSYCKPTNAKTVFDEIKEYLDNNINVDEIFKNIPNVSIEEILNKQNENYKNLKTSMNARKEEYMNSHPDILTNELEEIFNVSSQQFDYYPFPNTFNIDSLFFDNISTNNLLKSDVYQRLMKLSTNNTKNYDSLENKYEFSKFFQAIHQQNQTNELETHDDNRDNTKYIPYTRNTQDEKSNKQVIEFTIHHCSSSSSTDVYMTENPEVEDINTVPEEVVSHQEYKDSSLHDSAPITVTGSEEEEKHSENESSMSENSSYVEKISDVPSGSSPTIVEYEDDKKNDKIYMFSVPTTKTLGDSTNKSSTFPSPVYFYRFSNPIINEKLLAYKSYRPTIKYTFNQPNSIY